MRPAATLGALALAAALLRPAAPAAAAVELCAALDGSGSIAPDQFALQLEGLARAVEDPAVVPRDGSVTVSVVVFMWGAAVEVPATVVSGEADALGLAAAVRAIPPVPWPLNHRTDMVAAIEACFGQFRDPAARWVIDISTDGRHSTTIGTDPFAARDAAVAAGLDALNALGVGEADLAFLERLVWPQPASAPPADGFVVMVPDFTAYVAAMREKVRTEVALEVALDVKPGSCPNPFLVGSQGLLPVAVLGGPAFDVAAIDPATLTVAGVPPVRWSYEDVAAPFEGRKDSCGSCTTTGSDGYTDLVLHVDRQALAAAIGGAADRACVLLELRGNLLPAQGGGPVRGADVLRVQRR
ncbi:MAG TPA: DUF1194 domain-containing protein [bacterium]